MAMSLTLIERPKRERTRLPRKGKKDLLDNGARMLAMLQLAVKALTVPPAAARPTRKMSRNPHHLLHHRLLDPRSGPQKQQMQGVLDEGYAVALAMTIWKTTWNRYAPIPVIPPIKAIRWQACGPIQGPSSRSAGERAPLRCRMPGRIKWSTTR